MLERARHGDPDLLLLTYGSIRPYKGVDIALEALARVDPQLRVRLVVAGRSWGGGEALRDPRWSDSGSTAGSSFATATSPTPRPPPLRRRRRLAAAVPVGEPVRRRAALVRLRPAGDRDARRRAPGGCAGRRRRDPLRARRRVGRRRDRANGGRAHSARRGCPRRRARALVRPLLRSRRRRGRVARQMKKRGVAQNSALALAGDIASKGALSSSSWSRRALAETEFALLATGLACAALLTALLDLGAGTLLARDGAKVEGDAAGSSVRLRRRERRRRSSLLVAAPLVGLALGAALTGLAVAVLAVAGRCAVVARPLPIGSGHSARRRCSGSPALSSRSVALCCSARPRADAPLAALALSTLATLLVLGVARPSTRRLLAGNQPFTALRRAARSDSSRSPPSPTTGRARSRSRRSPTRTRPRSSPSRRASPSAC